MSNHQVSRYWVTGRLFWWLSLPKRGQKAMGLDISMAYLQYVPISVDKFAQHIFCESFECFR